MVLIVKCELQKHIKDYVHERILWNCGLMNPQYKFDDKKYKFVDKKYKFDDKSTLFQVMVGAIRHLCHSIVSIGHTL